MPSDKDAPKVQTAGAAKADAAAQARALVREAWKATLSTVSRTGGHPYGSLVAVAAEPDGSPLLLLSGLAQHTKNILQDQRASLLFDGTGTARAALTGARVTVVGRLVEEVGPYARRRYLTRHPDAAGFIDFADFNLYAMKIEWAHLVAGFGRIVRLDAADMIVQSDAAAALLDAEADVLAHMNEDHADAIALMAGCELRRRGLDVGSENDGAPWIMLGCDSDGIDIASGEHGLRVAFPQRVTSPAAVRKALVDLVQVARASQAEGS